MSAPLDSRSVANTFTNRLTIHGAPAAVAEVADAICDPEHPEDRLVDFNQIAPLPAGIQGREARSWRESHWGVAYTPTVSTLDHELRGLPAPAGERVYYFGSDGDAPVAAIVALATAHPELEIELVYHEPADQIAGLVRFREGRPIEAQRAHEADECVDLLTASWPDEIEYWL